MSKVCATWQPRARRFACSSHPWRHVLDKPPEAVAASMSVYWPASHYFFRIMPREIGEYCRAHIVATHTLRLGMHTCVAWAMFTGMPADRGVKPHMAGVPRFFDIAGVIVRLRSRTLHRQSMRGSNSYLVEHIA